MTTIALFGRNIQFKNNIGNKILNRTDAFVTTANGLMVAENQAFKIINTPDFFDENIRHPDQQTIDFMATSHPGPRLFILAIDSENAQEEKVIAQITTLQDVFGANMTSNLVIMFPDSKSCSQLRRLKEMFKVPLADASANVAEECKEWCKDREPFLYDYKNYSHEVVVRRKKTLEERRYKNFVIVTIIRLKKLSTLLPTGLKGRTCLVSCLVCSGSTEEDSLVTDSVTDSVVTGCVTL